MKNIKVLLVEDAIDLANAVSKKLKNDGYTVEHVINGASALESLSTDEFDVMLLDINIPKLSGFEVASAIRELDYDVKIIAITARDSIDDKLKGFELGFDDYVTKPFDLRELSARISVIANRNKVTEVNSYKFQDFVLNPVTRVLIKDSTELKLTKLEFNLLHLFLELAPSVVTNDEIINRLWGEDTDNLSPPVRSHVKNLRKKLGDNDFDLVKTIPGIGYKIDEVETCLEP